MKDIYILLSFWFLVGFLCSIWVYKLAFSLTFLDLTLKRLFFLLLGILSGYFLFLYIIIRLIILSHPIKNIKKIINIPLKDIIFKKDNKRGFKK